jgi:hypothetical protein
VKTKLNHSIFSWIAVYQATSPQLGGTSETGELRNGERPVGSFSAIRPFSHL